MEGLSQKVKIIQILPFQNKLNLSLRGARRATWQSPLEWGRLLRLRLAKTLNEIVIAIQDELHFWDTPRDPSSPLAPQDDVNSKCHLERY